MPQDSFKPEIPPFLSRYLIANPEEFASNLLRAYERGSIALAQLAERPDAKVGPYTSASEFSAATETLTSLAQT